MTAESARGKDKRAPKKIGIIEKILIERIVVPSEEEIRHAKADTRTLASRERRTKRIEGVVRAALPHITAAREAGMSFMKIHRVFANGQIDISVAELRETFNRLQPHGTSKADEVIPKEGTP